MKVRTMRWGKYRSRNMFQEYASASVFLASAGQLLLHRAESI